MVNPEELCKGNIVEYDNNQVKVVGFDSEYVYLDCITWGYTEFEEIFPIPLTEEILLSCGFEKSNRIDFGEMKPCFARYSIALMIRNDSFFIDWIGGNTEIKYVHQLQNFYYALIGKYLEFKA